MSFIDVAINYAYPTNERVKISTGIFPPSASLKDYIYSKPNSKSFAETYFK